LAAVLESAESDPSWDRALDARQVELAREADCVIGSRLALWMLPEASLKVYLRAGIEARSRRIWMREGGELEKVLAETQARDVRDRRRYKETYGIDTEDLSPAHLVIDTERWAAESIASIIICAFEKIGSGLLSNPGPGDRS
ncbi:MAG TPA: cytidylate kinase family protein, partial [Rectinemataceae bacterium]